MCIRDLQQGIGLQDCGNCLGKSEILGAAVRKGRLALFGTDEAALHRQNLFSSEKPQLYS